ncbi:hypothetical protein HPB48_017952 [Haemaphysalis longicornis]|uniref:C2H2-type domain-containing protein n=1 Tax=Haemaphysalis longicornis TaxID=44386 RepID=A0A9J6GK09_HAELO|nr:hypothetical protein HPB48_017952 [Haemaphysalis longicornis]
MEDEGPSADLPGSGPPAEGEQPQRSGEILTVFFPAPTTFCCTEEGCQSKYSPVSWTSRRQSLQRHLEADHGVRIRETVNVCSHCGDTLGRRPTIHECSTGASLHAIPTRQRHACQECEQTFPSRKGLQNHREWHRKEAARANQETAGQARPPQPPRHDSPQYLPRQTTPGQTAEPDSRR